MSFEVVLLNGGQRAVRSIDDDEVMHPGVGPLVEANALYVGQSRLAERLARGESLRLFDVGLGAGSNALAARAVAERSSGHLSIVSFERDLGALELALVHAADFALEGEAGVAAGALLNQGQHATAHTEWRLVKGDLLEALAAEIELADVIFWDPFSPRRNPRLWTIGAFSAVRRQARAGALLITYSASTATRVALLLAGFTVGIGASIGQKAQTTIATVDDVDALAQPLDAAWLRRLSLPSAPLPADAPADTPERVAALAQFQRVPR